MAEVTRVKVELQEQIGHLQAERTVQSGLKEKIAALEREIKGNESDKSWFITFAVNKKSSFYATPYMCSNLAIIWLAVKSRNQTIAI